MSFSTSERATLARVTRLLAPAGQRVCVCRPDSRYYLELGRYYAVSDNVIVAKDIDLDQWERELREDQDADA